MAAGPATAGYKQEPGIASTALPAPLREIGFDQNIDRRLPLETTFRDEPARRCVSATTSGRGR